MGLLSASKVALSVPENTNAGVYNITCNIKRRSRYLPCCSLDNIQWIHIVNMFTSFRLSSVVSKFKFFTKTLVPSVFSESPPSSSWTSDSLSPGVSLPKRNKTKSQCKHSGTYLQLYVKDSEQKHILYLVTVLSVFKFDVRKYFSIVTSRNHPCPFLSNQS